MTDHTGAASGVNSFVFPVLKTTEIIECMKEMDIPVTKAELQEPGRHRDRLRSIWLQILECCTGQTEDDVKRPLSHVTVDFQLPESHTEMTDLVVFRALRRLMKLCGYDIFDWRDLLMPNPKRLRHQLSAVINLAKFREEQLKVYAELHNPRNELIAALEEVNKENQEVQQQFLNKETSSEQNSLQLQEIVQECQELEQEIASSSKVQASARQEAARLKRQANDLQDEITASEWAIEELEAKNTERRALIVSSPDRRRRQLQEHRERLQQRKKEVASFDRAVKARIVSNHNFHQTNQQLRPTMSNMDRLLKTSQKFANLKQELEAMREKCKSTRQKTQETKQGISESERQLHRMEDRILGQRKQHTLQLQATQESLDEAKAQKVAGEKERRDGKLRVQHGEAEVRAIKSAAEEERIKTRKEIQAMLDKFKKMEDMFFNRDRARQEMAGLTFTSF